ncbi:MAG: ferredoxin [Peptostreptococcaceae bacterium]
MKAKVDKDTCVGCATCPGICPEIFSMDDDGKAVAKSEEIPENLQSSAEEARDSCPVSAIDIG